MDSRTTRALIFAGGIIILGVGIVITLGTALIGVAATTIGFFVKRRRGRTLTRGSAWVISVVSTVVPFLLLLLFTTLSAPKRTPEEVHRDLVAQRAQRESSPAWLRKLSTPPTAGASVDSVAVKLLENRGFMVWFSAVTALIGSSLVGAFAGSIAWGAMMMFYRAIKGEWMEAGAGPSGLAPAAPIRSIRNIG